MAEFPALPLWTDAYLADTRHLSAEQHGAYLLLLMEAWRRPSCSLPDDDALLARLSGLGGRWDANRDAVMAFWTRDGRRKEWTQKRLVQEREYVASKSRSQRDNAAKRWKGKKKDNAMAMPIAMSNACQTDAPTPTPTIGEDTNVSSLSEPPVSDRGKSARKRIEYPADFEAAWQAYPRTPNMSKSEALPAWRKLSAEDRALVLPSIPAFKAYCAKRPDYEVIHFCRYLSKRRFEGFVAAGFAGQSVNWSTRLGWARTNGKWSTAEWGPRPGQRGCLVPSNQLQPGDGAGWSEHERAA